MKPCLKLSLLVRWNLLANRFSAFKKNLSCTIPKSTHFLMKLFIVLEHAASSDKFKLQTKIHKSSNNVLADAISVSDSINDVLFYVICRHCMTSTNKMLNKILRLSRLLIISIKIPLNTSEIITYSTDWYNLMNIYPKFTSSIIIIIKKICKLL